MFVHVCVTTHALLKNHEVESCPPDWYNNTGLEPDAWCPNRCLVDTFHVYRSISSTHGNLFVWIEAFFARQVLPHILWLRLTMPVAWEMPKGTAVSPLPFPLYINNMPYGVNSGTTVWLFLISIVSSRYGHGFLELLIMPPNIWCTSIKLSGKATICPSFTS